MTRPPVPIPFTALVPAAGLGTRFLPASKTVPKELLPVVDTPGIELVAAEAAEAGAERLVIVTSKGKDGVVAHFVEDLVLEGTLEARGKKSMLEKVRRAPALIKVESVVQAEPLGLGHAVGCVEATLCCLPHPPRDRRLSDRRDRHRPEYRVHVAGGVSAVAREGGRLDAGQVVDMGAQPRGDRRDVSADLVELDDAQRLVRAMVLEQVLKRSAAGRFSKVSDRWRPSWRHSTR
jgi:hypothetical protein